MNSKPSKPARKGFFVPKYKRQAIKKLNTLWPEMFNDKFQPLQCDVRSHLLIDAGKRGIECNPAILKLAIEYYAACPRYLLNVLNAQPRIRLDGGTEPVKKRHQVHARSKLIREFGFNDSELHKV